MRFATSILGLAPLTFMFVSCQGTEPTRQTLDDELTAEARSASDAKGNFQYGEPSFPGGRPQNSLPSATAIADLYPRTFLNIDSLFSIEHEAALGPDGVVRCGRIFFAESAFDTLPRDWDAATAHRRFGGGVCFSSAKMGVR